MIVNLVRLPSGIEAGPGIDADESDSVEGYIPMVTLADFERGNGLASAVGRECIELAGAALCAVAAAPRLQTHLI
jgi:hypothetical protein